jgi:hypothetical protein
MPMYPKFVDRAAYDRRQGGFPGIAPVHGHYTADEGRQERVAGETDADKVVLM